MHARGQVKRIELFGVSVDALTFQESVQRIAELIEEGRPVQHVVLNASKVVEMEDDPLLREIISTCDMCNADGASIVVASRILGTPVPERVTGADLFGSVLELCAGRGWPVYLLGGTADVVEVTARAIRERFPTIVLAGAEDGYFDCKDRAVARRIAESGARVLFLGMPSPAKEHWLCDNLSACGPILGMGVGGTFDIWAGKTRRAPIWMQNAGLEWLYRLLQEPGRLSGRYLLGNGRFVMILLRELMGRGR
jgi:N-acetylglucosaminyldiphosphoundecaprenol N-acetyl-beta-D-mannosaminyltransferase